MKLNRIKEIAVTVFPFNIIFKIKRDKKLKQEGRFKYNFSADKYQNTFLANSIGKGSYPLQVREVIFVFWTGENEMNKNRKAGLDSLIKNSKVRVVLVSTSNLSEFILPECPLHPAYKYLSLVHKSDYLRCYFMHHYGGGYADVKRFKKSWKNDFRKLSSSDAVILGYREVSEWVVAQCKEESILRHLKFHFPLLVGNGAYICKPSTAFTLQWFTEVQKRLDLYLPLLQDYSTGLKEYPIPYTDILGNVFHPLCLKFHKYILYSDNIKPLFKHYK